MRAPCEKPFMSFGSKMFFLMLSLMCMAIPGGIIFGEPITGFWSFWQIGSQLLTISIITIHDKVVKA
jgi:hypothetical protein